MEIQSLMPLGSKTTMKIGGHARFFADVETKEELEEAWRFAEENQVPLLPLGAGSNTIFADGVIEALVIRIKAGKKEIGAEGTDTRMLRVEAGAYLGSLINELALDCLDLTPLTGIPGTIGGAIFGNAGQGLGGIWIDHYVQEVEVFQQGTWTTFSKRDCGFDYRESKFKELAAKGTIPIIWATTLELPRRSTNGIKAEAERLLHKRFETQPHIKTAGSCFKSLPDGTPAWKKIEAAGLRGLTVGGVQVSEKHANFLLNIGSGTFNDVKTITEKIRWAVPDIAGIEMRLYQADGKIAA